MTRADLQRLARERVRDAKTLLAGGRWSAGYYLLGYAVECALKACIIRQVMSTDQFPDRKFSEQCWTHNLSQLLGLAGLRGPFEADCAAAPDLANSWDIIKDWTEKSRYLQKTKAKAQDLYDAVTDKRHGVLTWIKKRW